MPRPDDRFSHRRDEDDGDYREYRRESDAEPLPEEIGVNVPGGWGVHAKGPIGIMVAVIVMSVAVSGFLTYRGFEQIENTHVTMTAELKNQTCILSMNPEERSDLRVKMLTAGVDPKWALYAKCPWLGQPR